MLHGLNAPHPARRLPAAGLRLEDEIDAFWRHHERYGEPLRSSVTRLADAALAPEPQRARDGTRMLFEHVVEPLCDAFTDREARTYRRAFAQIICEARCRRQCGPLDRTLAEDGIRGERDLLAAAPPLAAPAFDDRAAERVGRVVVLSRLTLGADVAITAVLLHAARRRFPDARVCCVGTPAARALTACLPGIDWLAVPYGRQDDLAGRLNTWPAVRAAVRAACGGASADGAVVIDPDSRLTQLGLLPPVDLRRYYHFPSRSFADVDPAPLGTLAGRWFVRTFGRGEPGRPSLALPERDLQWCRSLRERIGRGAPLVSVSLGLGGNTRKGAGFEFDVDLLDWIVRQGCSVLLARGVGPAEVAHARATVAALEQRGIEAEHLPRGRALTARRSRRPGIVTWEADVGAFFAAIACADVYVGYDSAGQHIAAALGVPTLSLFIESAGPRHAERWRPQGRARVEVVRSPSPPDRHTLLAGARAAFGVLMEAANGRPGWSAAGDGSADGDNGRALP